MIIADDEKVIRETIKSFINWKSLGVEVVGTCRDGMEAYNAILDEYPDIVLTDIKMPGFNGLELIERIKQIDSRIEFIILSGYEEFSFAKQAMKSGVRHYLLKPCNEKQIVAAVEDIKKNWYMNQAFNDWKAQSAEIQRTYQSFTPQTDIIDRLEQLFEDLNNADEKERRKIFSDMKHLLGSVTDQDYLVLLISGLLVKYADRSNVSYSPMQIMDYVTGLKEIRTADGILESFFEKLPLIFQPPLSGCRCVAGFITRTITYIEDHLADPGLSLKRLSEDYLFMNVDYVSKQFVRQTGYRFSDFLNRRRVEKAKQLLTGQADIQIPDVAEQIGFGNNPQYFYLIFKKYTGMTPSAYINSWKENP